MHLKMSNEILFSHGFKINYIFLLKNFDETSVNCSGYSWWHDVNQGDHRANCCVCESAFCERKGSSSVSKITKKFQSRRRFISPAQPVLCYIQEVHSLCLILLALKVNVMSSGDCKWWNNLCMKRKVNLILHAVWQWNRHQGELVRMLASCYARLCRGIRVSLSLFLTS